MAVVVEPHGPHFTSAHIEATSTIGKENEQQALHRHSPARYRRRHRLRHLLRCAYDGATRDDLTPIIASFDAATERLISTDIEDVELEEGDDLGNLIADKIEAIEGEFNVAFLMDCQPDGEDNFIAQLASLPKAEAIEDVSAQERAAKEEGR